LESLLVLGDVIYNQFFSDNLIFINKKWPNDFRIGCKSPFSLVELIETNVYLKEELEEFEKTLEEIKYGILNFGLKDSYNLQVFIYF
jgi:hypothetical protein